MYMRDSNCAVLTVPLLLTSDLISQKNYLLCNIIKYIYVLIECRHPLPQFSDSHFTKTIFFDNFFLQNFYFVLIKKNGTYFRSFETRFFDPHVFLYPRFRDSLKNLSLQVCLEYKEKYMKTFPACRELLQQCTVVLIAVHRTETYVVLYCTEHSTETFMLYSYCFTCLIVFLSDFLYTVHCTLYTEQYIMCAENLQKNYLL